MTPELLRAAGEALYGDLWQTPLADDLGVAYRTMRRWVAVQSEIPPTVANDLAVLIDKRRSEMEAVRQDVLRQIGAT